MIASEMASRHQPMNWRDSIEASDIGHAGAFPMRSTQRLVPYSENKGYASNPRRFALLTGDSPKSSHGHFRLVHLICVCSFNSGYLLLLFKPIYLFYIAVGGKLIIRKHAHVCFYFHAVVSINK